MNGLGSLEGHIPNQVVDNISNKISLFQVNIAVESTVPIEHHQKKSHLQTE
jgi:hypothetical protein